ncbi:MAG: MRP family ATP-binding protein [Phycisphaerales bacterium]|nr:MRP family ATP-binding protein [Phycisphaerales bacterium]
MNLTSRDIHDALRTVKDPDLGKDLVTLNMVKDVRIDGASIVVGIELTTPACPMKETIRKDVEQAIHAKAAEIGAATPTVTVEYTARVRANASKNASNPLPNVKHVIAVGAGKGGVGKSSIAVNLAVGLARFGARVGLLDGDIYGPSTPTMLGLTELPGAIRGEMLVPFEVHGIRAITIGKLVDPEKALIWRGPMAHGAFKQLALQTEWGELDYLIVDLPPGTGDVPLTLAQLLPLTGAVVVCTPQRVAQDDARRAVRMFQQLGVAVLGVVENMSYFIADDGKTYDIFGRGGAEIMARTMDLPFLGAVPIHMELRRNSDEGTPLKNWSGNSTLASDLDNICQRVASQISISTIAGGLLQPTLSITD